jgi:hypothetical protein
MKITQLFSTLVLTVIFYGFSFPAFSKIESSSQGEKSDEYTVLKGFQHAKTLGDASTVLTEMATSVNLTQSTVIE